MPTLKDNDFTDTDRKLYFPDDVKQKLMHLLIADTEVFVWDFRIRLKNLKKSFQILTKFNLMDYSLLVCIHDCAKGGLPPKDSLPDGVGELTESDEDSPDPAPTDAPVIRRSGLFIPMTDDIKYDEFYMIRSRPGKASFILDNKHVYVKQRTNRFPTLDAPKKEIYYIGLVDILTYYGIRKELETAVKSVKYGADSEISTIKPIDYAKRFLDFILKSVTES